MTAARDPFHDVRGKRMSELDAEQTQRSMELWAREQFQSFSAHTQGVLTAVFGVIDNLRAKAQADKGTVVLTVTLDTDPARAALAELSALADQVQAKLPAAVMPGGQRVACSSDLQFILADLCAIEDGRMARTELGRVRTAIVNHDHNLRAPRRLVGAGGTA